MRLGDDGGVAVREVTVPNKQGFHARPVMSFVDLASKFTSAVTVANKSRGRETVDGKSAMQVMLLEATKGCVLEITCRGADACEAADALVALVESQFHSDDSQSSASP